MHSSTRKVNLNYCSIYQFAIKLVLLTICCFLHGCGGQKQTQQILHSPKQVQIAESAININTATVAELETLPRVGAKTARNIVEFRQKFGAFRQPEHLLLVRGVSDRRFREIRNLIKTE